MKLSSSDQFQSSTREISDGEALQSNGKVSFSSNATPIIMVEYIANEDYSGDYYWLLKCRKDWKDQLSSLNEIFQWIENYTRGSLGSESKRQTVSRKKVLALTKMK